jgi:hypothetical protein
MPSQSHSNYMNDLIQSLPSPSPTAGITHTWMREPWMVDGEALVMMMVMISSKSHPGRVPERSFWFRISVSGGGSATKLYLGKTSNPPMFSGQMEYVGERRDRGDAWGGHTTPWRGLAWPVPPGGVCLLWPLSVSYSGSVCLLVK